MKPHIWPCSITGRCLILRRVISSNASSTRVPASTVIGGAVITSPTRRERHLQAGAVKALAIASAERHPMLPDVPTTAEAGIEGFELEAWFGLYAPAGKIGRAH